MSTPSPAPQPPAAQPPAPRAGVPDNAARMAQSFTAFLLVFLLFAVLAGSAAAGRAFVDEPFSQDFNGAAATLAAVLILALTVPWLGLFRWLYLRSV